MPSPGDLPNPGIKAGSPTLQVDCLPAELPGSPHRILNRTRYIEIQLEKYLKKSVILIRISVLNIKIWLVVGLINSFEVLMNVSDVGSYF